MTKLLFKLLIFTLALFTHVSDFNAAENKECSACHQQQANDWSKSHHAKAMNIANDGNVLGDFNNVKLSHLNDQIHFYKDNGEYKVRLTEGGISTSYKVDYTFGYYPLQQYLIAFDNGHYQVLPYSWDSRPVSEGGQRWYHIYGNEEIKPNDRLHWKQPLQSWNGMCADCHSTGLVRNFDVSNNSFATTFDNINIQCMSCHVLSDNHSQQVTGQIQNKPQQRNDGHWQLHAKDNVAKWTGTPRETTKMEQCYSCHSLRETLTDGIDPKLSYLDQFTPLFINNTLYHPDGQIKEEVYVYGSFLQSKMHQAGVQCIDCHEPHSNELKIEGNGLCLQCHNATVYQTENHIRHEMTSDAAQCVNCHMPTETYMGVDDRRDHRFGIPRPDISITHNTPNACMDCHDDQTNQWAVKQLQNWHGKPPELSPSERLFIRIMAQEELTPADYLSVINDKQLPPIKRASALVQLPNVANVIDIENYQAWINDSNELIRLAAVQVANLISVYDRTYLLEPMLENQPLAIRTEAVNQLLGLNDIKSASSQAALEELINANDINSWRGEGLINQSFVQLKLGELESAISSLRAGIDIDPYFPANYINLIDIYRQSGELTKEKQILELADKNIPQSGLLHYSYGLHHIRQQNNSAAEQRFLKAVTLEPNNAQFALAYVLTLERLGEIRDAQKWLQNNLIQYPNDKYLLQIFHRLSQK